MLNNRFNNLRCNFRTHAFEALNRNLAMRNTVTYSSWTGGNTLADGPIFRSWFLLMQFFGEDSVF